MFGNQPKNDVSEEDIMDDTESVKEELVFEEVTDLRDLNPEDIDRALKLLNADKKHKAKVKAGLVKSGKKYADMTPEEKERDKEYNRRRNMEIKLYVAKAKEAGITVTDEEVDEALLKAGKI